MKAQERHHGRSGQRGTDELGGARGGAAAAIPPAYPAPGAGQQWLSPILQSLDEAVMATDTHGGITVMNPRAEGLTGWAQAEVVGRHVWEVLVVRPEAPQAVAVHPILTVLRERTALDLAEPRWVLVAKDGITRPIDGSAAPLTDAQGTLIGAVLRCHDATERRQGQARRVQTQTMEAIRRLADGVAHDLDNLLTVISVYAELLLRGRIRDDQLERYITEIKEAVNQATALTDQLRRLSGPPAEPARGAGSQRPARPDGRRGIVNLSSSRRV